MTGWVAADADTAHDITEALNPPHAPPAKTAAAAWPVPLADVVAGWSAIGQDRIAKQIAAMTPEQRQRLIDEFPKQVGNTDGVPWDMRIAANRVNIAQAIADERVANTPGSQTRIAFYQGLLAEVDDPARSGGRVDRQILAFDPDRASLIELNGNLATAKSLAVMVPGMNTTIEESGANTKTARQFVWATRGEVATITYLGGPFPAATTWQQVSSKRLSAAMPWTWRRAWSHSARTSTALSTPPAATSPSPTSVIRMAARSWGPPRFSGSPPTARFTSLRREQESVSTIRRTGTTAIPMYCGFR